MGTESLPGGKANGEWIWPSTSIPRRGKRRSRATNLVPLWAFMSCSTMTFTSTLIYSYSKTNQMHEFLKIIILVEHSTCFGRSFCPSSGAQDCAYSNGHMSNRYCYMLASKQVTVPNWHILVAVCTVLSSWWWTERPPETSGVFCKKNNLGNWYIWLVLL
jgi:hypothetical protein